MTTSGRRLGLLTLGLAACAEPSYGDPVDLVTIEAWRWREPAPPFDDAPTDVPCDSTGWGPGSFGPEPALDVQTGPCPWLTIAQPTLADVGPRDRLYLRLWHELLTGPDGSAATLAVGLGGEVVWETTVPIPADGGIVLADEPMDGRWPAGSEIAFHLDNHGANSYHLFEIGVRRPVRGGGD